MRSIPATANRLNSEVQYDMKCYKCTSGTPINPLTSFAALSNTKMWFDSFLILFLSMMLSPSYPGYGTAFHLSNHGVINKAVNAY